MSFAFFLLDLCWYSECSVKFNYNKHHKWDEPRRWAQIHPQVETWAQIHHHSREQQDDNAKRALSVEASQHNATLLAFLAQATYGKNCCSSRIQIVCDARTRNPDHSANYHQHFAHAGYNVKYLILFHWNQSSSLSSMTKTSSLSAFM